MDIKIKDCFVSRFGMDGYIVEADYNQLEVTVAAEITKCPSLTNVINSGKSMHDLTGASISNLSYEEFRNKLEQDDKKVKEKRMHAKVTNFQVQYGCTKWGLSNSLNITPEKAQEYIDNYYQCYQGLKNYHDILLKHIETISYRDHWGKRAVYKSLTGRLYLFNKELRQRFIDGIGFAEEKWNEPQIKNYTVQGMATADIVPLAVASVWDGIKYLDDVYMINSVHDCIVLDIKKNMLDNVASVLKERMEGIKRDIKKYYNYDFKLPLTVTVEYGPSWGDMKEYKFK